MTSLRFEVDLNGAATELERLQHPPFAQLEAVLAVTFAITEARVHVLSGELKASGRPLSSLDGDEWSGTLEFDRYPGIYELARGNRPTRYKGGTGSHFFFDPVQAPGYGDFDTEHGIGYLDYKAVVDRFLEG